jgi:hypothetical protein
MHNLSDGQPMTYNFLPIGMTNRYLLRGSDAGSTCLHCHQQSGDIGPTSYHVSTPQSEIPPGIPPKQLTPAGDFGWLRKTFTWVPALGSPLEYSYGDNHGHNIIAQDYGYFQDALLTAAPGGTYQSAILTCISCHDPHGRYRRNQDGSITTTGRPIRDSGSSVASPDPDSQTSVGSYRMLGGVGYYPKSIGSGVAFLNKPPAALVPETYNRSEAQAMTRAAYGSGMSEWCGNCHAAIHDRSDEPLRHPHGPGDGELRRDDILTHYNRYVKTGDLSGTEATAYLSLVPFEIGTSNYATLKNIVIMTPTKGPSDVDGISQVSCLTCHRAHASGWDNMTRWNTRSAYVVNNGNYSQEGQAYQPYGQGRSELEALRAMYDIPANTFAAFQDTLCHKCHETVPN